MLERVFCQLFVSNHLRRSVAIVLDALESDPSMRPTHWSPERFLRDPYDRQAIESHLRAIPSDVERPLLYVRRAQRVRYISALVAGDAYPAWMTIESDLALGEGEPERLVGLLTTLAQSLNVEFGLISFDFEPMAKADRMKMSGYEHESSIAGRGPSTLWPRNFVGPTLASRLGGIEGLSRAGLRVNILANGVIVADLLDAPWAKDAHALKVAQLSALTRLKETGVFGA